MSKSLAFVCFLLLFPVNFLSSSEPFFQRLEERAEKTGSVLCLTINPRKENLTDKSVAGLRQHCERLIKESAPHVLCYSIRVAFFESYGPEGMQVMKQLIEKMDPSIPVILDTKSGDVSSCAQAYKEAYFDHYRVDAVTLSPFLGIDSIDPFLSNPFKGVFLITKTSNPSSDEILNLPVDLIGEGSKPLYELLAKRYQSHPLSNQMGIVVGARDIEAIAKTRQSAPCMWILSQGTMDSDEHLSKLLRAALREDGRGVLVSVSEEAVRSKNIGKEIAAYKKKVNQILDHLIEGRPFKGKDQLFKAVARGIIENKCVQFGLNPLDEGNSSNVYVNLRKMLSDPKLMEQVAALYLKTMKNIEFDKIAGLPYAGLPITAAIAVKGKIPMIFARKEKGRYSRRKMIEGNFHKGDQVLLIDDSITSGGINQNILDEFIQNGLEVKDVLVLLNRESGGEEKIINHGIRVHSVFKLSELVDFWVQERLISQDEYKQALIFLAKRKEKVV